MDAKAVRTIKFCRIHQKVFHNGKWLCVDSQFLKDLNKICANFQLQMEVEITFCDRCRKEKRQRNKRLTK